MTFEEKLKTLRGAGWRQLHTEALKEGGGCGENFLEALRLGLLRSGLSEGESWELFDRGLRLLNRKHKRVFGDRELVFAMQAAAEQMISAGNTILH